MKTLLRRLKPLNCTIFVILVIAIAIGVYAFATAKNTPPSQVSTFTHVDQRYTQQQSDLARDIVRQLNQRHYVGQPLNDQMASQHLDNYLRRLDSNRLFLLQSDIDAFEAYRSSIDNRIEEGDLTPAFVIFDRYQERLLFRLSDILDHLPQRIMEMDFTIDEDLIIDRSEKNWPKNQSDADEIWRKMLKHQVLNLRLADKTNDDIVTILTKRYQSQIKRVDQLHSDDIFQLYINALTEIYDPHTNYLSPAHSENFTINMSLKLEGIGAILQADDEYTKVVRLIHAGPADKQGELQPADRITAVAQGKDGEFEDVVGWRLDEVVQLIRGSAGSTVRLEVIPASATINDTRKIIEIVRNEVALEEQSAQKSIIDITDNNRTFKVGIIAIPAFYIDFEAMHRGDENYTSTTRDVIKLLNELLKEDIVGVVIDLRANGGGSLQEANALTGLFIDSGATVQIRHANSKIYREGKQYRSNFYSGPLVVLINRLSASASEIFAGAIQDYQRGLVVGTPSFGKGTVQSITPLKAGQLKMTESKFYRISGDSTQHRGVIPDILFPAVYDKDKVGESTFNNALPWDTINPLRHPLYFNFSTILPQIKAKHRQRTESNPDFIFLREQMDWLEKASDITAITLNEASRKTEQAHYQQQYLAMENKRRIAKGLVQLTTLDEDDTDHVEAALDLSSDRVLANKLPDDEAEQKSDQTEVADQADPLLVEAAHILVDSIPIYPPRRYAAGTVQ